MDIIISGTYRHGHVELINPPKHIPDETAVLVTFPSSSEIDLAAHGIDAVQAAELRASLAAFTDWDTPEMEIYDDYDAAKAKI